MTWPAVIGLGTAAGGGRFVRGGNFNPTNDVATWAKQAAGACCEAGGFTTGGDSAGCDWPAAGAGLEVGGFDAAGDEAAFGWLAGGLTRSAGRASRRAGRSGARPYLSPAARVVRPVGLDRFTRIGAGDEGGGLAVALCPLMGQSDRSDGTGSRGLVRKTGLGWS